MLPTVDRRSVERRATALEMAAAAGFTVAGIAPAAPFLEARRAAVQALGKGQLAEMQWMTNDWIQRATEPSRFLDGCRSLVITGLTAGPSPPPGEEDRGPARGRVARYAWGRDYHRVFEPRLKKLAVAMRQEFGGRTRTTVDYGPVLERSVAAVAGVGWLGKSTMLLVPGAGPWVLLGVVGTTVEIAPGRPLRKNCGSCRRCVDACPTGALGPDGGALDSRLCLSYLTIENRGAIPLELREAIGDRVFGCDECLEACPVGTAPWRSDDALGAGEQAHASPPLAGLLLDEETFRERFRGRALMRVGREGLARNACVALGNCGRVEDLAPLLGALRDRSAIVRGHAAWGTWRLVSRLELDGSAAARSVARALAEERDPKTQRELQRALSGLRQVGREKALPRSCAGEEKDDGKR